MAYYLLVYASDGDYLERRKPFRAAHLALAQAAESRGELLLGGAYSDGTDGAVLVFRAANREAVEAFARADPYVKNGVVDRWAVREWAVVAGAWKDLA